MLDVILRASRPIADGVQSMVFEPVSNDPLPGIPAGSHICVILPNGMRPCYSLVDAPSHAPQRRYTIAVRRNAAREGASHFLCTQAKPGDRFQILPPADRFPLVDSASRHVLIAGGIGITPLWSMIQQLASLGRDWTLHYAAQRRVTAPFIAELQALEATCVPVGERLRVNLACGDEGARLDIAAIVRDAPIDAHLYCCGPSRMIEAFRDASQGRDKGTVHWEHFDSAGHVTTALAATDAAASAHATDGGVPPDQFEVVLSRSGVTVPVPAGRTILDAVLDAGIATAYGCRQGNCGACETGVLEGTPDHRDWVLSDEEREANRTVMICCSRSRTARLVLDM